MKTRDREADMKVVARMLLTNLKRDSCEYGGWGLDPKRPFGNSDPERDILRELGVEPDDDDEEYTNRQISYAASLYDELGPWLIKFAEDLVKRGTLK